jgi:hypothetical protein
METIRDIFVEYAPDYIERFKDKMPEEHLKVIDAIINCRTESCGIAVYECTVCGEIHHVFRSCGNRHCPTCQHQKAFEWMGRQFEKQVPGHHFMATFTVPEEIREFIRSNQREAYGAMFKASSDSIKKMVKDDKYAGGDLPGFLGVLHTWGSMLPFHPHIHYIIPGGAFSRDDGQWHPSRIDFFLPVKALSKIYKAKFKDQMTQKGLIEKVPPEVWEIDWNVNIQAVGDAENSIRYLSPYIFKVAISDHRIVSVEDGNVTFQYKKKGSSRPRTTTVNAFEFLRRFLQHVLPSGFMKVRYYGFMNPNSSIKLEAVRQVIELCFGFEVKIPEFDIKTGEFMSCPTCGSPLKYLYSVLPFQMMPPPNT